MSNMRCPGLPADWINAWLAAVGATVLAPRLRLHWTDGRTPFAVLSAEDSDPLEVLTEAWPTSKCLTELPLYEKWGTIVPMGRRVTIDTFVGRVREARGHPDAWTLSSTMTDLHVDKNGEVAHAPLDPSGPGTVKWLHHRLLRALELVESPGQHIAKSLEGTPRRMKFNGLGFDLSRLGSQADDTAKYVDPAIEVLAFFGLALLPVRGRGWDERLSGRRHPAVQRGWRKVSDVGKGRRFAWPAWSMPLDPPGVDALLDIWRPERKVEWARVGVHAAWHTVTYTARDRNDMTRGFGSVRM